LRVADAVDGHPPGSAIVLLQTVHKTGTVTRLEKEDGSVTGHFRSSPVRISAKAVILLGLLVCGMSAAPASAAEGGATDVGIRAFKEICLASAPSFANGTQLAKKYGVETWLPLGKEKMGMTKDHSLSVQIKPGRECAITTPTRPGATVHTQFMNAIISATKPGAITEETSFRFSAIIGGKKYLFGHIRRDGEAYVKAPKD
jgi:hypothetical protein